MRSLALLFLMGLALAVGCGGGGGSDAVQGGLSGDYHLVEFGVDSTYGHPRADGLRLRFDEGGQVQYENDAGRYVPYDTFEAHADGTVDFTTATGVTDAGGGLLASGVLVDTEDLAVRLALRTAWWADASLLQGWYTLCFLRTVASTGECSTSLWAAHAENGAVEWTVLADSEGAAGQVGIWTYDIEDGDLVLERYIGAINAEGTVFLAKRENAGGSSIVIGVRRDQSEGNRLLGDYAGYSFAAHGLDCTTGRFSLAADGAAATRTTDWSDGTTDTESFAYDVTPVGYLRIGGRHFGALTHDGGFFVGVDTDRTDGGIGLHLGVRP